MKCLLIIKESDDDDKISIGYSYNELSKMEYLNNYDACIKYNEERVSYGDHIK